MEMATGKLAIEKAARRARERLHLIFFGGEPLLRWETLVDLTQYAREVATAAGLALRPTVTSNGTLLSSERARWLGDNGFVTAISCDGCQPAHDANRVDGQGRGSHARTVAGIRAALAAGMAVRVVSVLDPSNLALLAESAAFFVDLGVRDLVLNPNWSADWRAPGVREVWADAYQGLADLYVKTLRDGVPLWVSTIDSKIATHIRAGMIAREHCDRGRRDLVVAPGGNLYPCDRMVGEDVDSKLTIGHIETGVDASRLRVVAGHDDVVPAECVNCAVAARCRNRCACANLAMTGSFAQPSELLCFHEQLAIRVADKAAVTLVTERNDAFLKRHYPGLGMAI
jgi:radical SAM additional 4Fe4S-binding domain